MPKTLDLRGRRFGRLTVVTRLAPDGKGALWWCECDCGGSMEARTNRLTGGQTKSCGCARAERLEHPAIDITGKRFGILTAVAPVGPSGQGWNWHFRCDCGRDHIARAKDARHGNTASCGCLKPRRGPDRKKPAIDINRPWRKDERVDDRWLHLVGQRAPQRTAA